MFTGLITHLGKITNIAPCGDGSTFSVSCNLENYVLGESIAVNGVCLTVTAFKKGEFTVQASCETLSKSNLGRMRLGTVVHLERALRVGDSLGGHIVAGHVDTTAVVKLVTRFNSGKDVIFGIDPAYTKYIVEKGSIAVDGASLTVNRVKKDAFSVMLIPHTQKTLAPNFAEIGRRVNIEVDMLGKYVEKLLSCNDAADGCIKPAPNAVTIDKLRRNGFC